MGLGSAIFGGGGGYGSDNADYRNQAEWSGTLERIALQAKENPAVLEQYFNTPSGQQELKKLGFESVNDLMSYASNAGPNVQGSQAYGQLGSEYGSSIDSIMQAMQGQSGELTDFGANYKDISDIPDQVWGDVQEGQEEQAARGFKGALQALGSQYGQRGFRSGTSGFEQGSGSSLGRGYLEQLRNISRDVGAQKANSKLDVAKFNSNQGMARANYLTQLQQYAKNFGSQNLQNQAALAQQRLTGMGAAYEAQNTAAMQPYQLGQDYYNGTMNNTGPASKKGIFGSVLNAGAGIAGEALKSKFSTP